MSPSNGTRPTFAFAAAAVVAVFLALVIATALTKAPWCDEAWFASPGWNLAFRGFMGTTVLDPASGTPVLHTRTRTDGIDRYTYWVMPLSMVIQAGWYRIAGFSLLRMRALSIIWALGTLVGWWMVFRHLSDNRWIALVAAALLALDYHFLWVAADGRMDMLCSLLGVAGLVAYLQLRERNLAWALVTANTLFAVSVLAHPNADLYFLALACLVLMLDRARLRWQYVVLSGVPYLAAGAAWLPYILKAPDLFKIQLLGNTTGRESAFTAPFSTLEREIQRYLHGFGFAPWSHGFAHVSILELLAFVGGVAWCAAYGPLRRQNAARYASIITGSVCLFLWLFEGAKSSWYLVHVVPWLSFALAVAAGDYWAKHRGPRVLPAAVVGMVLFLAIVRLAVPAMRDNYHRRFQPAAQYVQQHASPSDLIMGSAELAFYVGFDWNILDDIMLGTTTGKHARFIVVDARYADYQQSIRTTSPADYQRVSQLLRDRYEKVYDQADYQIYRERL